MPGCAYRPGLPNRSLPGRAVFDLLSVRIMAPELAFRLAADLAKEPGRPGTSSNAPAPH